MADKVFERATPPVKEKIAVDVHERVNKTIETVRGDLDRAGFDRNDKAVKEAIRQGIGQAWEDGKNR